MATESSGKAFSKGVPNSREFAKAMLDYVPQAVSKGLLQLCPYWPHAVQMAILEAIPEWMFRKFVVDSFKAIKAQMEAKAD